LGIADVVITTKYDHQAVLAVSLGSGAILPLCQIGMRHNGARIAIYANMAMRQIFSFAASFIS
jgi:hypothetical protein